MSKRTIETFARRVAFGLILAAGAAAAFGSHVSAQQISADCQRLREAIADASRGDSGAQYQAAADRQRAELDRTTAYTIRSAASDANSCSSARRRRPNAAKSQRRLAACAPISMSCSSGPAAAPADAEN